MGDDKNITVQSISERLLRDPQVSLGLKKRTQRQCGKQDEESDADSASVVEYVARLVRDSDINKPTGLSGGKNASKAAEFRLQGNAFYKQRRLEKALGCYSLSILHAPSVLDDSATLALAYANRSAVHLHGGHHQWALDDIDRAMEHGYPEENLHKLKERKLKCLQAVHASGHGHTNGFRTKQPVEGSHIVVRQSQEKGRHTIAKDNIAVGDVCLAETPIGAVLYSSHYATRCYHCFKVLVNPVPCYHCTLSQFCSHQCRETATQTYHTAECPAMGNVRSLQCGTIGHLAFRLLTLAGVGQLLKLFERYQGSKMGLRQFMDSHASEQGTCLQPIFLLLSHNRWRPLQDFLQLSVNSAVLVKLLLQTKPWTDVDIGLPTAEQQDLGVFLTGLTLEILGVLACNGFEVTTVTTGASSYNLSHLEGIKLEGIGMAIYNWSSCFNHSCTPSAEVFFAEGHTVVMKAITPIAAGSEVSIDYGVTYCSHPREKRQAYLQEKYFFQCDCQACSEQWYPVAELNLLEPVFKCTCCSSTLHKTSGYLQECKKCNKTCDVQPVLMKLAESHSKYSLAIQHLHRGETAEGVVQVLEGYITLMDQYIHQPWGDYFRCKAALRQCYRMRWPES